MKYSTLNEAIQAEIADSIEATGVAQASEYDIDAIADKLILQKADIDENGVQHGNVWYELDESQDFWQVVEDNAN
ncbi:MAG: hypothetical protein LKI93_03830 [Bifidobacteriaceae bacterium]|jgi:hypothetical protein|nr:hypothetical protein [Bifidobacteriaceae bacterium]MCI1914407.1 hypothetical protein [Bifidobacteriaceae bacterium]MCI1935859.1 hypothetical protein [Bifidobacteriaceae bacterium]